MVRTIRRSYFGVFTMLAAMALLCVLATSSGAAAGDMTLVSQDNSGAQGDGASSSADISSDGRFVAFTSSATNLVASDTNGVSDVFVRDLRPAPDQTTTIERVSVGPAGVQAENGDSLGATISADGRYVAFVSGATNLVANDTNGKWDVFVHDRKTGANIRANVSDSGNQANETSPSFPAPSISDDGRYVAFLSFASNLVANDTISEDVFVHDRDKDGDGMMDEAGETRTERVSQAGASSGYGGNGSAYGHSMSSDGRYVAFYDSSSDLVAGDTDRTDIFVRDRQTGSLQRIRMDCSFSLCATHLRRLSSISDDGRYVAFQADATSVVTGNNDGVDSLDDVFVRDRQTGSTQRVGVNSCGTQANGNIPTNFSISSDGRFLAFHSTATNLVEGDTNNFSDAFVRHLKPNPDQLVKIERVSVSNSGTQAIGSGSNSPSISADGRYVAFGSGATNLVEGDTNGQSDIFVHERGDTVPTEEISDCIAPTTTANATTTDSGATYTSDTWTNESLVEVTFSAQDNEGGSGVKEIRYSASGAQSIPQTVYDEQNPPVIDTEGTTTLSYFAIDKAGNRESPAKTFMVKLDKTAPTIGTVSPTNVATGISPTANVEATFSEEMDKASVEAGGTFTLTEQSAGSPVGATVGLGTDGKTATLNPNADLKAGTSYTAMVTTAAKDKAGNALAQDHTWTFTTASPPCTKTGTANAETISGTSAVDVICAGGGNDTVKGLGGNDTLKGEAGNDTLLGGVGNDSLDGGLNTDTASYSASLTAVNASLATNSATGEGSDTFSAVENLLGSSKADTLTGSTTNNKLTGGGANDTESGGAGNDTVIGSGGADTLKGEDGADAVNSKDGVNGNDSLDGGVGTDTKVTDTTEKSILNFP